MTKICTECEYRVPEEEEARHETTEEPEDCPKCGGLGTVVDESELADETIGEGEG